jgi:cell division septal protein FtsQ
MSKTKKVKTVAVKKVTDPKREAAVRRVCVHIFCALTFVGVLAGVGYAARGYVARRLAFPSDPPKVVLVNRPSWMSDLLAEEIIRKAKPAGAHSAFDHQVLVDINRILVASPWIRKVREVRRVYQNRPADTIEIDCEYRAPVALVQSGRDTFWLVDGDGVVLPAQFNLSQLTRVVRGADGKMNIRVISGVQHKPVSAGAKWPGEDLAAGLDMVKLLYGLPYAEEIVTVNVSNYAGRDSIKEAQISFGTTQGNMIKWGRPINGGNDFFIEISTQRKLQVLRQIYEEYGHVDASQEWVDIRLDKPTYPSTVAGMQN